MVVSDSLGAPKGYEDSPRGWIWARGCMLRLLVSYFPAGFFSPSPLGCVLQNLPLQLLVARLSTWPPLNPCGGLCCDIQLRGLGGGGGSVPSQAGTLPSGPCGLFVRLLPHTSSPALCAVVLFEWC